MFLKSLEIQGFKSFPDKTKLNFTKGLTAVVGPNGSGKSNISDAVRWVLGEQSTKTLRGNKMEDVIFTGTKNRKPLGFSEVSITIDNSERTIDVDNDEITITRKYYRSGESEYKINNANVRLKDIHEMLMDTGMGRDGYSIIGQGRIAEIVSAKSNERREIFEEAAGISKYRYRKEEAEKRLNLAEENMLRLTDILSELESRVEPLRVQSEKAKKYITLAENKKKLEISLWMDSYDSIKSQLKGQEDKIYIAKGQYEDIENTINNVENKINEIYEQTQLCSVTMEKLRESGKQSEEQSLKIDSDIAVLNNEILHCNQNIERIKESIKESERFAENTDLEINLKQEKIKQNEEQIAKHDADLLNYHQQLSDILTRDNEFGTKAKDITVQINTLSTQLSDIKVSAVTSDTQIIQFNDRLVAIDQLTTQKSHQKSDLLEELRGVKDILATLEEKKTEHQNYIGGFEYKLNKRISKFEEYAKELSETDRLKNEKLQKAKLLTDLENNFEGFAYSVKHIITEKNNSRLKGICGPVSKLIDVSSEYDVAIETALGGALQNIIVETEIDAKNAINLLKQGNKGRATFLPITSVKGNAISNKEFDSFDGFIDIASNLVGCDAKYKGIIDQLLGRTVVVEDLDCGTFIAKKTGYKYRIVTIDGQLINAGGSFTGGSVSKNSGLLSRSNEINKLNSEAAVLKVQVEKQQQEQKLREQEINLLKADIQNVQSELIVINEDKIRFTGDLSRIEATLKDIENDLNALKAEKDMLVIKTDELKKLSAKSEHMLIDLKAKIEALEQEYLIASGSTGELQKQREEISNLISETKLKKTALQSETIGLSQTLIMLNEQKDNHLLREESLRAEITVQEQKILEFNRSIEQNEAKKVELLSLATNYRDKITAEQEKRLKLEQQASSLRNDIKAYTVNKENASKELARLEERHISMQTECDTIISRMWDEYEITRSEAMQFAEKIENKITAQKSLSEVKNSIKALGNVNLSAIDEYAEVKERYEFLKSQLDDIVKSKQELQRLINDLTINMRNLFSDSFEKINYHFGKIFTELFEGGSAYLKLSDENNVLESGIDIFVEPPGKIIKNLAALSGGEQAFVAIAIYFAILKVRPAPFCLLDEIEAALDDVNVSKYAAYLRKMNNKTQFVLITHRRGTMEEADVLYGVTMQEEGVSKLLELNVSEVSSKLNLK